MASLGRPAIEMVNSRRCSRGIAMSPPLAPFSFRHATQRVVYEAGGVRRLDALAREFTRRRAVLVVDPALATSAILGEIREALGRSLDAPPTLFITEQREPDTEMVVACVAAMRERDPDMIVAIGGGSTMDAAKVARLLLANPGTPEAIAGFDPKLRPHQSLLVCVPTTAGTGSEVSEMAIISKTGSDVKLRYRAVEMTAQIALLDPLLTVSMPGAVTANTGFDAFTHALESFVSRAANHLTDALAWDALTRLVRNLPIALADPGDVAARGENLVASMQAAMAFNTTMLGMAHAIAAPLGALHSIAHGLGNALALPAVTAFNESLLGAKGEAIARALGAASASAGVSRFRHALGLDRGLDDFVTGDAARAAIAEATLKSGNMRTNPRSADAAAARLVVEAMRRPTDGRPLAAAANLGQ
jgi:alcohol dehydrogenase